MGKGNRNRKSARRAPSKEPKKRILAITEGTVTEPEYLSKFAREAKSPMELEVIGKGAVPLSLVKIAVDRKEEADRAAKKDANEKYEMVWCVFDVDDHPSLSKAKQLARSKGIFLAISNPCFELWLLLHFTPQPGMQDRERISRLLKKHDPKYNKHVDFDIYYPKYDKAKQSAEKLTDQAVANGEEGTNPSTGVYQLTESLNQ